MAMTRPLLAQVKHPPSTGVKEQESRLQQYGIDEIVRLALSEDIGTGDITTTATVPETATATGTFRAKAAGVVSGIDVTARVFEMVDPSITFEPALSNGDDFQPGDVLATVTGPAQSVLTGERVSLNFLQRLSGVATVTASYVAAVKGTGASIIDTRKTTPGMRLLEKAAIRHGGGHNHRVGLSDGILIKDNHLAAIGDDAIRRSVAAAREAAPHTLKVEVEVTSLEQLEEALDAGADIILLDNMDPDTMRQAVKRVDGKALLEASGGITYQSVRDVARTGVDLISVGALTHSAPSIDISLQFQINTGGDA
jgi:nicotinate-nucleotide pyrophosphorylase (carboxylating)